MASTSARVTAGRGRVSLAITTAVFPVKSTGASTLTSPRSDEACGATTPTTPVGSGTLKLKNGPATGLEDPATWATLSDQPAYQTQRSTAASTLAAASSSLVPSLEATASANWERRLSSISATR